MSEYTEGICDDGAAILKDGVQMTISEVLEKLNNSLKNPENYEHYVHISGPDEIHGPFPEFHAYLQANISNRNWLRERANSEDDTPLYVAVVIKGRDSNPY
jgi:hypothetical protein